MGDKVPVECRIWYPDGTVQRIRGYVTDLQISRDFRVEEYDETKRYIPGDSYFSLAGQTDSWKMRHGRPEI